MVFDNPVYIQQWNENLQKIENEQQMINDGAIATLSQIPDEYHKIIIENMFEVKQNKIIENNTQFKCDYRTGILTFHPDKICQAIMITEYYGRGIILTSAKRIFDQEDGQEINLDTVKTLQDYIDSIKPYGYKGDYIPETTYSADSMVSYDHTLYRAKQLSVGVLPTNTTYWQPMISVKTEADWAKSKGDYALEQGDIAKNLNTEFTNAEDIRVSNEDTRLTSETSRGNNEITRINAEDTRVGNENLRVGNENLRVSNEDSRVSNEDSRVSNEDSRVSNEDSRVIAETARTTSEDIRVSNEDSRVTVEGGRVASETARIDNEDLRIQNEELRASTVTAIENNYAPRLTTVETDLADILNKTSITTNHIFADTLARDTYFTVNPTELIENTFIAIGTGFQQYLDSIWVDKTAVLVKDVTFKTYGVKRTLGATSPLLDRIYDSMGLVATMPTDDSVVQNDFDNIYPWSQIKECKRDSTGRIYYAGDPGYDVVVGDWLIEIPKFFIQITQDATYRYYATSQYKQAEFWCPQAFKTEAGLELDKIYVGRFKTGKVDGVDVSRPDLIPENYRNIDSFRAAARAKGDYWQLTDLSYVTEVLHMLYLVEYASLYSQDKLGAGMTEFEYNSADTAQIAEDVINRIVVLTTVASRFLVGQQIGIGTTLGINNVADKRYITAINVIDGTTSEIVFDGAAVNIAVGNIVWSSAQRAGQTKNLTKASGKLSGASGKTSFKYRGLEDPFGNVYEWVDGVLIDNNIAQICRKPSLYSSTLTADYKAVNYININANGYPLEMGFDNNYPEALFPKTIGVGSSTGFTDYYYQTTGLMAALLGGGAIGGFGAGLFFWILNSAPSYTSWGVGARILFKPPV